jgi:hypothetical protein
MIHADTLSAKEGSLASLPMNRKGAGLGAGQSLTLRNAFVLWPSTHFCSKVIQKSSARTVFTCVT